MKPIVALAITLAAAACGPPSLPSDLHVNVRSSDLGDPLLQAIAAWNEHGVALEAASDGLVVRSARSDENYVHSVDFLGNYDAFAHEIIVLDDPAYNDPQAYGPLTRRCVIEHELGHFLGMQHVDDDRSENGISLMNEVIYADQIHDICFWSSRDDDELCRATGVCRR